VEYLIFWVRVKEFVLTSIIKTHFMKKIFALLFIIICCNASFAQVKSTGSQSFSLFWSTFQKNLKVKTYLLSNISFPYFYSCNYLDPGKITKKEFEEQGIEIFVNGNAFISYSLDLPLGSLSIKTYTNLYMDEYLKNNFLKTYGNLSDVYVISEKGNENDPIGYKAYFKLINGEFKFIGFEGQEQGD